MIKKIITIILSTVLFLSTFSIDANAESHNVEDELGIVTALNAVESVKEKVGLDDVYFTKISYSDSIMAYDYTSEGIVLNSEFIPLLYNNTLIGWVIKVVVDDDTIYQFSNAFVDEVNSIITNDMEFAIIYDYNSSYLYNGTDIYLLGNISLQVEGRTIIESSTNLTEKEIILSAIKNTYKLNYIASEKNGRATSYYECSVGFVSQNPPSKICWTASTASIVNYIKGTSYTAVAVAKAYWGSNNYNLAIAPSLQDDVLNNYNLYYEYRAQVPSSNIIVNNIQRNYPIQAYFICSSGGHATVLYGINVIGSYYYLMDPEYGFCSTTYSASGGHRYVSGYSGVTLTLSGASCRYWIA